MQFEIYNASRTLLSALALGADTHNADWRWRLRAGNGQIIASGEGYRNKGDCLHAIDLVKAAGRETPIQELG